MKLQMIFILMDLFTLTIIPFVFLFEKLRQLRKGLSWGVNRKAM